MVIPADRIPMSPDVRFDLIKKISVCENGTEQLDSHVVDECLNFLSWSKSCHVFATLSPYPGNLNPYYAEYIRNEKTYDNDLIILPLCNGRHFYGYIVDKVNKKIVFIDSLYKEKSGRRAISKVLKERFFPRESSEVVRFYPFPVQYDGHSCGGWLVFGMIYYAFCQL